MHAILFAQHFYWMYSPIWMHSPPGISKRWKPNSSTISPCCVILRSWNLESHKVIVNYRSTGDMVLMALNQLQIFILGSVRLSWAWRSLQCLLDLYLHQSLDHHSGIKEGFKLMLHCNQSCLYRHAFSVYKIFQVLWFRLHAWLIPYLNKKKKQKRELKNRLPSLW